MLAGWFELHHRGEEPFDLGGMGFRTDLPGDPVWRFPAGATLPPGGFLVVRCDGTRPAAADVAGRFNTGWSLPRRGGVLKLLEAGGRPVDSAAYGFQVAGRSLGRVPGGWQLQERPTPAGANAGAAVLGSAEDLRVNEWLAAPLEGADWLELYNRGDRVVALTGLHLTDDPSLAGIGRWPFPALKLWGPRACLQVEADGRSDGGSGQVGFRIGRAGRPCCWWSPGKGADAGPLWSAANRGVPGAASGWRGRGVPVLRTAHPGWAMPPWPGSLR